MEAVPELRHRLAMESGVSSPTTDLRSGQLVTINGARVRFLTRARVQLVGRPAEAIGEGGPGCLFLELRSGELLIINGATLRFVSRARIQLMTRARFLFGKQIMQSEAANTPARRLYLALQSAYVGGRAAERGRGLERARALTAALMAATTSDEVRELLACALATAEAGQGHEAIKLAREIVALEDARKVRRAV